MIAKDEIAALVKEWGDERVLSVYLNVDESDPAKRGAWRTVYDRFRSTTMRDAGEDVAGLQRAWETMTAGLPDTDSFVNGRGWVGFATPDRLLHAGILSVPTPDFARWDQGPRIAGCVRAFKQGRIVVVAIADRRRARLFEYQYGELAEVEDFRTDLSMTDPSDSGVSKRAVHSSGVRGATAKDMGQEALSFSAEQLLDSVAQAVVERLDASSTVIVGGTADAVSSLLRHLPDPVRDQVVVVSHLHVAMHGSEIKDAVEVAVPRRMRDQQQALLHAIENETGPRGHTIVGRERVAAALSEGRVETLWISRRFIRDEPDRSESFVRTALVHATEIEEFSAEEGARIDADWEGVAARLRYIVG